METFGPYLTRQRQLKGVSLDEVAARTRIDVTYLLALEEERFGRLPPEVFTRGFVRAYARTLGLDETETFRLFQESAGPFYGRDQEQKLAREAEALAARARRRRRVTAFAFLTACLGVVMLVRGGVWPPRPSSPPRPEGVETVKPAFPSPPAPIPLRLVLEAIELTWVSVRIDQALIREALLKPGDRVQYEAAEVFHLTSGNAGGLRLELNGRPLPPLGRRGQVVREVRLARPEAEPRH